MEAVAATAAPADTQGARAIAGDRDAFDSLYRPRFEAVYDFVLRIVGERELAADVVRETFARAWRAFPEQGKRRRGLALHDCVGVRTRGTALSPPPERGRA